MNQAVFDFVESDPVAVMLKNRGQFTDEFVEYLPANLHVFEAFEREAWKVIGRGFKHYSARTIVHVLRHHSAVAESGSAWKVNNNHSPYFARLFGLMYPEHADLWEYRETKAVTRASAFRNTDENRAAGAWGM